MKSFFYEGTNEPWMYVIEAGKIGIYVRYGRENAKRLTVLEPGQYFGEMGMLDVSPRSATAVALQDNTKLVIISQETFAEYFRHQPVKVVRLMQGMGKRIRGLTEVYLHSSRE